MAVSIEEVKKLREMTGAGMMSAKKALEEAGGDVEKAIEALRVAGEASAAKKADRVASAGVIASYVHAERIGVIVEVNCETDFVARTEDFKTFARDMAMHVAASNPLYLDPESVPGEVVEKEQEIYRAEVSGKPDEIVDKIVEGKLAKYYEQVCLTKQPFVKDPDKSVEKLTAELVGKLGENIVIRNYSRLELGVN